MRRIITCWIVGITAILLCLTPLTEAQAITADGGPLPIPSDPVYCANDIRAGFGNDSTTSRVYRSFGQNMPIVLVHGQGGEFQSQWGLLGSPDSLIVKLDSIPGAKVAAEFQYSVTPGIDLSFTSHDGPLAHTIDCMAHISTSNGGRGKVIVIGYSEGSAITHKASTAKSDDGTRDISNEIGQILTIADAREFYNAPDIPNGVIVHASGGDIIDVVERSNGSEKSRDDTYSDGLVRIDSALSQFTPNNSAGGGSFLAKCEKTYLKRVNGQHLEPFDTSCDHGVLLRNVEIQSDMMGAIETYLTTLPPVAPSRSFTVGDVLTIHPDDSWGQPRTTFLGPTIYDGLEITHQSDNSILGIYRCGINGRVCLTLNGYFPIIAGTPPSISIDGQMPDDAFIVNQGGPKDVWCFTSKGICIAESSTAIVAPPAQKILDEAFWTN